MRKSDARKRIVSTAANGIQSMYVRPVSVP
jgi:hypothetical protein